MAHLLTPNGVHALLNKPMDGRPIPPITVQVIHVKKVDGANGGGDRYRLVLSDGEHYVQGMLATQINHLISEQPLEQNCLMVVQDYMANAVQAKTIIILLQANVLDHPKPDQRINNPVDIFTTAAAPGNNNNNAAAAAAQPLYNSTNNNPNSQNSSTNTYNKPNSSYNNRYNNNSSPPGRSNNPYGRSSPGNNNAPIMRSETASDHYTPIKELNLYNSRWTIRARVTHKSDIRTWNNAKGEGTLFNVDLLDASGYDIRATFFKDAVDKFFGLLQVGSVYTFSGGRLKVANAKWNTCKSPNEITFDQNSEIHLSNDEASPNSPSIQTQAFEFLENIAALEHVEVSKDNEGRKTMVDVLGYVTNHGEPSTVVSAKKGKEFTKVEVTLVDDSGAQVSVTLWEDQAHTVATACPLHELVALRRATVSDYSGRSLSGVQGIILAKDDAGLQKLPAVARLQQWYQETKAEGVQARSLSTAGGGARGGYPPMAERKPICSIQGENMGFSEKGDYLSFQGTIVFFKKDKEGGAWYPACPNSQEPCRNRCKVTPSATGGDQWHCERCNGTFDRCVRKWIFSGVVEDPTSSTWVTFFDDAAIQLFDKVTADEIYQKSEGTGTGNAYESVFVKANYTEWIFKCRVKQETHNEEQRRKTSVMSLTPVNHVAECKELLTAIDKF